MTATPPLRELPVTDQAPQERGDAARNRTLLIDAARRLIAERGADAVTTDDIAAAAGVGKGTLFRRFGSRAGLMIVLLDVDYVDRQLTERGQTLEQLGDAWESVARKLCGT